MISVVIPTLNEANRLPRLLEILFAEDADLEVIVVDGGSSDGTDRIACSSGARLIRSIKGRGLQLQSGALSARGETLWFLHADCLPGKGAASAILSELRARPESVGGNFKLLFDGNDRFSDWLNGFYAKIRQHGFYYGDSGIFVGRNHFLKLGGYRSLSIMEDYDFVRRLEKSGSTLNITSPPLQTSTRRFAGRRRRWIIWGWIAVHVLFYLKVPSPIIAWLYDSSRRREKNGIVRMSG